MLTEPPEMNSAPECWRALSMPAEWVYIRLCSPTVLILEPLKNQESISAEKATSGSFPHSIIKVSSTQLSLMRKINDSEEGWHTE